MKWFLIQSFFLAVASFGLGALFHRLLWKRSKDAGSPPTGSVTRFSGDEEADHRRVNDGVLAARAAELAALQVGHEKVLADRDAKIKEFAALSFEHSAAKAALADRDESVGSLRSQLEAAALASSAASGETRDLRGQVASQRVLIEELRAQLVAANADNHAALATMRTDTDGRLADLSSEHDAALAQLRVDYAVVSPPRPPRMKQLSPPSGPSTSGHGRTRMATVTEPSPGCGATMRSRSPSCAAGRNPRKTT